MSDSMKPAGSPAPTGSAHRWHPVIHLVEQWYERQTSVKQNAVCSIISELSDALYRLDAYPGWGLAAERFPVSHGGPAMSTHGDTGPTLAGPAGSEVVDDDEFRILEENEANEEAERCHWRLLCQT